MGDEGAFLSAITAAPADRAQRLIYADWLDEHGHPDRAEYLRLLGRMNEPSVLDRLRELAPSLDSAWVARVCPEFPAVHPWYIVLQEVARGELTAVYEAAHTHPNLRGRRVALQILNDPRGVNRFFYRCQMQAALGEQAHVPPIYDVGGFEDHQYSARQFVDGDDLLNNIRARTLGPSEVVRVVTQVATALDAAHLRGIVHGCVHPRHVLMGRDRAVWLIGFGEFPSTDEARNNPLHAAPEQFEPGAVQVGPPTDVYLLAEMAAWLLGGEHPFRASRRNEYVREAKRMPDAWRLGRGHELPAAVIAVLRRAMSPDAAARYPTPGEFANALADGFERRPWWRLW